MSVTVHVTHRGQQIDFVAPVDAPNAPQALPLLSGVSDWFERGCVDQINGHQTGESPSATIILNNPQGAAHAALAYPLGATVTLSDSSETLIAGLCVRYSVGPNVELAIEL